ncbi:hypothetical protein UAU_01214 [Enterococcus pallens ATCC BAA-351]|uniref:Uncharacterized protein n=1 Tax=Enterococcus pallens ATCC BAA-351 TaxID=1158607 RepID=R2QFG0_9ENTE|nr:hypothetical protein UAU_01214 [Enterococcus pallens ATCC BAA-351]
MVNNTKIKGYSFITDEYQAIATWKEFFINVIRQIADINLNPLIELSKIESPNGLAGIFSNKLNTKNSEVVEGIYVHTSLSNWSKMNYIRQLLDLYKVKCDSLMVDVMVYENKEG